MKCSFCGILSGNRFCNRCFNTRNLALKILANQEYEKQKANRSPLFLQCEKRAKENNIYNDWSKEEFEYEIKNFFFPKILKDFEEKNEKLINDEMKKIDKFPALTDKEMELIIFLRCLTSAERNQIFAYIDYFKEKYLSTNSTKRFLR